MKLLTNDQLSRLIENGKRQAKARNEDRELDLTPVVKLFLPDGAATWLLTEIDDEDPDIAFGLCDLGMGCPELGTVRLSELRALRGRLGLRVERDLHWEAAGPLSAYVNAALKAQRIIDL